MANPSVKPAVVHIPADKLVFTVGEIPTLLAQARWPHVEGRRISYPLRLSAPNTAGAVLSSKDKSTLSKIWEGAGMPAPVFPMSELDWQRYVDVFNASEERPDWELWGCVEDDGLTNAVLRAAAEESYASDLRDAIARGEVVACNPLTGRPAATADVRVKTNPEQLLLSRDDFVKFARSPLMEVVEDVGDQQATISPSGTDDRLPATGERPIGRLGRQRIDAVGTEIEEAIARIQGRDTRALIDKHTVMRELVGRAGSNGSCVIEPVEGGLGIVWLDSEGQKQKLTKDALKSRLKRRGP